MNPSIRYTKFLEKRPHFKERQFHRHSAPEEFIMIPRCQAATASGEQCKNESSRWDFCYQHRNAKDASE